jgi:pilus assembly protein CpaB
MAIQRISTSNLITLTGLGVAAVFIIYGGLKVLRSVPRPVEIAAHLEEARPAPVSLYIVTKALIARGDRVEASSLQTLAVSGPAPADATTSLAAIVGKIAITDIPAHQLVLTSLVTSDPARAALSFGIPPGFRAITLRTNDEIAVGNFIHPSDRIDIVLVLHPNALPKQTEAQAEAVGDPSEAHTVLQGIEVLAVGDTLESSVDPKLTKGTPETAANMRKSDPPKSITVAMTPDQISQFILARSLGSFYLTLRNPADPQVVVSDPAVLKDIRGATPPPIAALVQTDRPIELITGNRTQTIYSTSRGSR